MAIIGNIPYFQTNPTGDSDHHEKKLEIAWRLGFPKQTNTVPGSSSGWFDAKNNISKKTLKKLTSSGCLLKEHKRTNQFGWSCFGKYLTNRDKRTEGWRPQASRSARSAWLKSLREVGGTREDLWTMGCMVSCWGVFLNCVNHQLSCFMLIYDDSC